MANLTKFQRSQKAHNRLARKYGGVAPVGLGTKYSNLSHYHMTVQDLQYNHKRVLTKSERQNIFDMICKK